MSDPLYGVRTALVTPFCPDGSIDWAAFEKLIAMQCDANVTGILFLGTTGENPTLTDAEGRAIVTKGIELIRGRCRIMVNVGTNSTQKSIENIQKYGKLDRIDAFLLVNPYYNKPTQTGLFLHFSSIAQATQKPCFIYNIKGRTAINLETTTLLRICDACPNVVGVKEASGDIVQIKDVIHQAKDGFIVLSGDDGLTLDVIEAGGNGVISVASNFLPQQMVSFVNDALQHNHKGAHQRHTKLNDFFVGQFMQTNPLPIKTALATSGIIQEQFRLPLCPMDQEPKQKWLEMVKRYV